MKLKEIKNSKLAWDSVWYSVGDSIWYSVWYSVVDSLSDSVMVSIRSSVLNNETIGLIVAAHIKISTKWDRI